MAYDSGFSRRSASEREIQPVAIVSVDPDSRTAIGVTRVRSRITINCSYATGDTITTPATGEQWYCERFDMEWRLYGRIPFNDPTLNIKPEEGQVSVGSARGPLELNGPEVRINSKVFRLNGVYYRDSGEALERSTDQVTWTAVSAATASTLAQQLASMLAGYQGTDEAGALLAIKDWGALVQLIVDNFSQFWNLLCDNSFVTGLKGLGFGDTDVAKIIDGLQNFLNYLFGTIFCDFNGDITPQVLLARIRDLLTPIASNPFVLALQEFSNLLGGTTNGLLQDAIDGVTKFLQTLFDVLFCQADPTDLQAILDAVGDVFGPVSIIQAIETFFDVFRDNLFLQGLSSFLNTIAPSLFTGNLLQDAVIGGTKFLGTLFGILTCDPTSLTTLLNTFASGTPGFTTPQGILAALAVLVTSLLSNPLVTAITTFATNYLGLTGTLLQQILTGSGDLFNWFFKALKTFLPFVPWEALLPFVNWTAVNAATVPGLSFPSLDTTNLFNMFDSLFSGLLGNATGAFKNFITNLGTLLDGMGLLDGTPDLEQAVKFFLTNILGIASYDLNGVLQFGGTLVSNVLGAVGSFFENISAFLGFDLRDYAEGALSAIDMVVLFLNHIRDTLTEWVKYFILGGYTDIGKWAEANVIGPIISNFLTGLNLDYAALGYKSATELVNAGVSVIGDIAKKLLTSLTQIPANLISGVLPTGVLGTVPVSSVSNVSQNLLSQGGFGDSLSIEAADGWSWDNTVNQPGGYGGSAKVTVSPAKNRYLYSRQAVPVASGDRLVVSAKVKTQALNLGVLPITIAIIPFDANGSQVTGPISIGTALGPSADWSNLGNTKDSPYTVTDSTWKSVIVRLGVSSAATSGYVWFDEVTVAKTGTLLQGNVDSLNTAWNQLYGGLKNTGQSTSGKDWTDLFVAANEARQQADYGYTYSTGTNSVLFNNPQGGSQFYSPQSLINTLANIKADGVYSMSNLLYFLASRLSQNASAGSGVADVYYAADSTGFSVNTTLPTASGRINGTNTVLFNDVAGGSTIRTTAFPTVITAIGSGIIASRTISPQTNFVDMYSGRNSFSGSFFNNVVTNQSTGDVRAVRQADSNGFVAYQINNPGWYVVSLGFRINATVPTATSAGSIGSSTTRPTIGTGVWWRVAPMLLAGNWSNALSPLYIGTEASAHFSSPANSTAALPANTQWGFYDRYASATWIVYVSPSQIATGGGYFLGAGYDAIGATNLSAPGGGSPYYVFSPTDATGADTYFSIGAVNRNYT